MLTWTLHIGKHVNLVGGWVCKGSGFFFFWGGGDRYIVIIARCKILENMKIWCKIQVLIYPLQKETINILKASLKTHAFRGKKSFGWVFGQGQLF